MSIPYQLHLRCMSQINHKFGLLEIPGVSHEAYFLHNERNLQEVTWGAFYKILELPYTLKQHSVFSSSNIKHLLQYNGFRSTMKSALIVKLSHWVVMKCMLNKLSIVESLTGKERKCSLI